MGATGDSNAAYTDQCGTTSSGYNGQWQFNQLISEGVSFAFLELSLARTPVSVATPADELSSSRLQLLSEDELKGLGGYERIWDQCSQTPFLFNADTKHMIIYDDSKSAGIKAAYARSEGLGGVYVLFLALSDAKEKRR